MVWHVDNKTAPLVKPRKQPVFSNEMRYFTDEIGQTPTIPQADWFNMIQGEVVQLALSLGVAPDKLDDGQIGVALGKALAKINADISKLPKIIDALGDSKIDGASQRIVNVVNTLAKNAQTAANLASDKANQAKQEAYEADQKAVAAQTKANQVPNPIKDQFLVGNTATGYKLITKEELITLLAIPGHNQKWTDLTGKRLVNVEYKNTSEKLITLFVRGNCGGGRGFVVDGILFDLDLESIPSPIHTEYSFIQIPPGSTYKITFESLTQVRELL